MGAWIDKNSWLIDFLSRKLQLWLKLHTSTHGLDWDKSQFGLVSGWKISQKYVPRFDRFRSDTWNPPLVKRSTLGCLKILKKLSYFMHQHLLTLSSIIFLAVYQMLAAKGREGPSYTCNTYPMDALAWTSIVWSMKFYMASDFTTSTIVPIGIVLSKFTWTTCWVSILN